MRDEEEYYPLESFHAGEYRRNSKADRRAFRQKRLADRARAERTMNKVLTVVFWIYIVFLGAVIALNIAVTVIFLNDSAGYDAASADFHLYKNSQYAECAANASATANCSLLDKGGGWSSNYGIGNYIDAATYGESSSGLWKSNDTSQYDWCATVSCVKDYTVLPSTPRPFAIGYTATSSLTTLLMIALPAAWAFRSQSTKPGHDSYDCPGWGLSPIVLILHQLCSTGFWWHSFAIIISNDRKPQVISPVAWIGTWQHAYNGLRHPNSCWLDKHPGYRRPLTWILAAAAAAQCAATMYVITLVWPLLDLEGSFDRRYDCLALQPSNYSSSCPYQQVCAKNWLFSDLGASWLTDNDGGGDRAYYFGTSALVALTALIIVLWPFLKSLGYAANGRHWPSLEMFYNHLDQFSRKARAPSSLLLIVYVVVLVGVGMEISMLVEVWNDHSRPATVAYDTECLVAHVALSPWRQYLDIDDLGRILRIVKTWFNA